MNRLTRKIKGYYSVDLRTCLPMEYEQIENSNACVDKLGKLEDIEEELGIDLIALFRALNDGIYVIEDNDNYVVEDGIRSIEHWGCGWGITTDMESLELLFKDYGKTWALTKEELEDDN